MNKWLELIIGLILVVATVLTFGFEFYGFGQAAIVVLKGGIVWGVMLIGILFILLGISDLRE